MTLYEAIGARHSVRRYKEEPISPEVLSVLQDKVLEVNRLGGLHVQMVTEEPRAFSGLMAYGSFSGVRNYFVMAGKKADDLDERTGYYGEQLVLLAQTLGLNTCWAGLSYSKIPGTYELAADEKIVCYIALGYGLTQGAGHKVKEPADVSNAGNGTPDWFDRGVEASLLAPTAVNQQKFRLDYLGPESEGALPGVSAKSLFSMVGYTKVDLGIVKYHFELGAGKENFEWA